MSNTRKWVWIMVLGVMAWGTALAQPANNTCATASNLTLGSTFTSSNQGATTETVPACSGTVTSLHTVWYRFTGNGGDVTLSTCNMGTTFDTQIEVYAGTCAALVPVVCNNNDASCNNPRSSTLTVVGTAIGQIYYVRIGGVAGARGAFTLSSTVSNLPPGCNTGAAYLGGTVPTTGALVTFATCYFGGEYGNITLGGAGTFTFASGVATDYLTLTTTTGTIITAGTTPLVYEAAAGGSFRLYVHTNEACGTQTTCRALTGQCTSCTPPPPPPPSEGCTTGTSWLGGTVPTTGVVVTFSTCYFGGEYGNVTLSGAGPYTFRSSVATDFLTVTNSTGTEILAFGTQPLLFDAPAAGSYRLYVHTNSSCATQSTCRALTGQYTPQSGNDFCDGSLIIDLDGSVTGTNVGATTEVVPACPGTAPSLHTVWYRFVGNGAPVILSTCGGALFDTQIEVYEGTCTALVPVACNNNDYECAFNRASTVEFETVNARTYYVRVGGVAGARGTFTLTLTVIRPENNDCANAITVGCGDVVEGTTLAATIEPVGTCVTALGTAPGVWYTLQGTGDIVTIETCGSPFDTKLGVFTGTCGSFTCVTGNDDACGLQSRVFFPSVAGQTYYILVTGFGTASGPFTMSVTCQSPVTNDECSGAIAIACGETLTGSTIGATINAVGTCGTPLGTAPGVWYSFQGTDELVTMETCGSTFDTKLGVFSGDCEALVCVTGNDDACGLQSRVSFFAESGETYYILVTGFGAAAGNFTLSVVTCQTPTPGCNCVNTFAFLTVAAPTTNAPLVISDFAWAGDYHTITNAVAGNEYTFTSSNPNDFLTVMAGSPSSAAIDCGTTPLTITAPANGTLYVHINTSSFCGTENVSRSTSVACSSCSGPVPLLNDNCAGAIALTPGTTCNPVAGTVAGATQSIPSIPCDGFTGTANDDVWYSFVATATSHTIILDAAFDAVLDVRSGACNGSTIGCSDTNFGTGIEQTTVTGLTVGATYLIRIYSWPNTIAANPAFTICVTTAGGGALSTPDNPGTVQQSLNYNNLRVGELYPNPTRGGEVFVDVASPEEGTASVQLFDQLGRLVSNTKMEVYAGMNQVRVNAHDLTTGTYFATIRINDEVVRRKLVVTR